MEEAIGFANCLLTDAAFRVGAMDRESVEPMYSILEEAETLNTLRNDEAADEVQQISQHIVDHAVVTWENYFVAPPGNQPLNAEIPFHTNKNNQS